MPILPNGKSKFNNRQARRTCFSEFLRNIYGGKPPAKEDFLALGSMHFKDTSINQTSSASAASLYVWYAAHSKVRPTLFALLSDLGYTKQFDITAQDLKESARRKIVGAHLIFNSKSGRQKCFSEFLRNTYGGKPLTKEDILALSALRFRDKALRKTPSGTAAGLYTWYGYNSKVRPTLFTLLSDLGYVKQFGISKPDLLNSARQRKSDAVSIFNSKSRRQRCFSEFLRNIYGDKPLHREDLLALNARRFNDKALRKTSSGSAASLYSWHIRHFKGQPVLFTILDDLGYARQFGITAQDLKQSASQKISDAHFIFNSKSGRQKCFSEFLRNTYGGKSLSRGDLVALTHNRFKNRTLRKTSSGSAASLYVWYAAHSKVRPILFAILSDLGYARLFGITPDGVRTHRLPPESLRGLFWRLMAGGPKNT